MSKKSGTPSLSNGTLSLRFMQRGATQRVSTTAAKVSDEAEWDIGPAARAALGVSSDSGTGSETASRSQSIHITRDDSYISFMFDRDTSGSTSQRDAKQTSTTGSLEPGRRRIFRQGTEVTYEPSSSLESPANQKPGDEEKKLIGSSKGEKKQQPRSISGPSSKSATNLNQPRPTASGPVRRHRLEGLFKPPNGSSPGFVKPAGIATATSASVKRTREDDQATSSENHRSETRRRRS